VLATGAQPVVVMIVEVVTVTVTVTAVRERLLRRCHQLRRLHGRHRLCL